MSQDKQSQKGMSTWVWLALLATVVLTFWTATQEEESDDDDMVVVANDRPRNKISDSERAKTKTATSELPSNRLIDWDQLARESGSSPKNLFSSADWTDRKKRMAQRVEKAPPTPPQAPPIPFNYMGRMDDGPNGNVIYLADRERSYTVKIGSKVGQQWRLDQEDKNNLHFTYLPLNLTRTMSKEANGAAGFN